LETVFQEIDLADTVTLQVSPQDKLEISCVCLGLDLPSHKNLAYRAAVRFAEAFSITDHIDIHIKKSIPSGAGLGGGSSNAACVLRMLAEFYQKKNDPQLSLIAVSLGADVPFFLQGGTAVGRGVGEVLESTFCPPRMYVITLPDVHVPTAKVFENLSLNLTQEARHVINGSGLFSDDLSIVGESLYNRLEEASFRLYPELKRIKEVLRGLTGKRSVMSGSGSAFLTFVSDEKQGQRLLETLKKEGYRGCLARSVIR